MFNCFLLQLPISQLGNACCFLFSLKRHHPDYRAANKEEKSFFQKYVYLSQSSLPLRLPLHEELVAIKKYALLSSQVEVTC